MLDHLHIHDLAEANRDVMRRFYGILKPMDSCLNFTFITGVSKFSKTSIFSELNNLLDITLIEEYASICGVPVEELDKHFGQHIESLKTLKVFQDVENIHNEILAWYDGYSWDGINRVLNPFALLSFFSSKAFSSFWYSSGSPRFLINMIKDKPESFLMLKDLKISERSLDNYSVDTMRLEPLLFQTGYLSVKEVIASGGRYQYTLRVPNLEVSEAFHLQIIEILTDGDIIRTEMAKDSMLTALKEGNPERVLELLRSLFASIPYQLHGKDEAYYHSIFYAVMTVLGFDMDAEVSTSRGRVDAVLELDDKIYVMEFKYAECDPDASDDVKRALFDKELDEAMVQIVKKGCSEKYKGSGKTIYHTAFSFLGRDQIEMRCSGV